MTFQGGQAPEFPYDELHFLVIDDNQMMRHWLRGLLTNYGAKHVEQASTFSNALRLLKSKQHFDVVLCDYNLDDNRDGQQLFEEVRRNNLLPATSVWIMVTGEREYVQIFSAIELLPDDYLLKPFSATVLHERVNRALHRSHAMAEPSQYFFAGRYDICVEVCRRALLKPTPYANDLRRMAGEAMLRAGDYALAHEHYVTQLQSGFDQPWVRLGLARTFFHTEKNDEARELLELLMLESPDFLQAHDWMAQIQERQGNPQIAKEILAETLHKNPKALWRHREIVRVALQSDDPSTAARAYDALHNYGRGSSFLSPGDFSGYALLLLTMSGNESGNKLRQLKDYLRNYFADESRFDFAHRYTEHALAVISNAHSAEAHTYARLKKASSQAIESNDRLALLNAAIRYRDDEVIRATAMTLFLDHAGNDLMQKRIIDQFPQDLRNLAEQIEAEAKHEAISLDKHAVALAKAGKLSEAIEEFDRLTRERPTLSILFNAGVAVAKWIEKNGWNIDRGRQMERYMRGIKAIDPASLKLKRLQDFCAHMPSVQEDSKAD